jgi:hypothetical protein
MRTPWGRSDPELQVQKLAEGVYAVRTPSHGGIMVQKKSVLGQKLTLAARVIGTYPDFPDQYCYEEDVEYVIPTLELSLPLPRVTIASLRAVILDYFPSYAASLSIVPQTPQETLIVERRMRRELVAVRREKRDPDLIVSAVGIDDTKVRVTCADGVSHIVSADSYDKAWGANYEGCSLSATEEVKL